MHSFFIIVDSSGFKLTCYRKGNLGQAELWPKAFQPGDLIEVTDKAWHVAGEGWFALAVINDSEHLYISLGDLERELKQRSIISYADSILKMILWKHQLNLALDREDREWFAFISRKIAHMQTLLK